MYVASIKDGQVQSSILHSIVLIEHLLKFIFYSFIFWIWCFSLQAACETFCSTSSECDCKAWSACKPVARAVYFPSSTCQKPRASAERGNNNHTSHFLCVFMLTGLFSFHRWDCSCWVQWQIQLENRCVKNRERVNSVLPSIIFECYLIQWSRYFWYDETITSFSAQTTFSSPVSIVLKLTWRSSQ